MPCPYEQGNERFNPIKGGDFLLAEKFLGYQGLCSAELVDTAATSHHLFLC